MFVLSRRGNTRPTALRATISRRQESKDLPNLNGTKTLKKQLRCCPRTDDNRRFGIIRKTADPT